MRHLRTIPTMLLTAVLAAACGAAPDPDQSPAAAEASPQPVLPQPAAPVTSALPQLAPLPPSGEGMWPWSDLSNLDEEALRARGLRVPLGDLWTPERGGLLRAAVGLRGCSASFVSDEGLLITNHHCAFRAIQRNATEENNILENGFVAQTRDQELDGAGLRVYVFNRQTDVTGRVLGEMPGDLTDLERARFIEDREKALVKECEAAPNTRCQVSRNNDGLSFILLENLEIKDVRLVAVPPRSLGEFGGEIDNWQWPRHTMDFAFIRAYVDKDGKVAEYSPDNVPFKPRARFSVSPDGVAPGDLVMVVGTPYRTARYRTLAAVREDLEWFYPLRVDLFSRWIGLMEEICQDTPDSCLPTSSLVKTLGNTLTNANGMIEGLRRSRILERKAAQEEEWRQWIASDADARNKWGTSLDDLTGYIEASQTGRDRDFHIRYLLWGVNLFDFARTITKWEAQQARPDDQREPGFQDRDRDNTLDDLVQAQRSLHLGADKRILKMFLARLGALPPAERIGVFDERLGGDYSEESITRLVDTLYAGSNLGDVETRKALFGAGMDRLRAAEDAWIDLALELMDELNAYDDRLTAREGAWSRLRPPYIESLTAMRGNRFYPDANASPRVSFATVAGYSPEDGRWHSPLTTLSGLRAKVTGARPFDAPRSVLEAIDQERLGPYADQALGDVPVCFLSNADTSGGNSGSPALDARGRLVGLNFDRVYENISGDYGYNPLRSRNIMVEIRSILWYLDEVIGADHILAELGIASPSGSGS